MLTKTLPGILSGAHAIGRRKLRLLLLALATAAPAHAEQAVLFDGHSVAGIVHDQESSARLAGDLLARDLRQLTGQTPLVSTDLARCPQLCIVIGRSDAPVVRAVAADADIDLSALPGTWERYARVLARSRSTPERRYLLIAGSDARGAVWGTIDLTRELGISAWEWWADVTPRRVDRLAVDGALRFSREPSVRYRGIFLNDEDWGLQPWAAKTFEPEVGDIGPKTYARIFELMWRLKANLIWPAMHDSTKPFYQIAGNAETARAYDIVVGTSHAEPLMRNNVREWDEATRGPFNFFTNPDAMIRYWRQRVEEVKGYENLYTVGLRGKHDSAMEGADTPEKARDALARAIAVQRELLATAQARPVDTIPQALTLYKEVLDVYAAGLAVPEDVTLVWPEDNYGYVSQLPTPREQARSGGSGVYYHLSYWGRPHDYLWLATTHPALVREQMGRAWQQRARRIWVVNVGDIKPGEYLTQYFLDLAFDDRLLESTADSHLRLWAGAQFGMGAAPEIAGFLTEYYDLAFERRPEFMGFSQTEPTRPIRIGDYVRTGGDEAHARIDRYVDLVRRAEALAARMPADRQDAFFQLVLYPVRSAARINERNLLLDLAALYTRQGRASVNAYAARARAAHAQIVTDTTEYNARGGGKWRGMMDMAPRQLPVFAEPPYPSVVLPAEAGCAVDAGALTFVDGRPATHRLTIRSRGLAADWTLDGLDGVAPSARRGILDANNGFEQRIAVRYDGGKRLSGGSLQCQGRTFRIDPTFRPANDLSTPVEIARTISLSAVTAGDVPADDWERVEGLGSRGTALRTRLTVRSRSTTGAAKPLSLPFTSAEERDAELRMVALPSHPLTSADGMRIGVRVDDGPVMVLDFETHGRSEEWKANVLSNTAVRTIALPRLAAGAHRIRLYALDPGFLLDRIDVRLDGAPDFYGAPPIR